MERYDHVAKIYDFAKENGYKVQSFNTLERRNKRGFYNYVEVAFVVPTEPSLTSTTTETEKDLEKDEVNNHEI